MSESWVLGPFFFVPFFVANGTKYAKTPRCFHLVHNTGSAIQHLSYTFSTLANGMTDDLLCASMKDFAADFLQSTQVQAKPDNMFRLAKMYPASPYESV